MDRMVLETQKWLNETYGHDSRFKKVAEDEFKGDLMVLETQIWLNKTYGHDSRFKKVAEDGFTGWGTIKGLIMGMQIEIGASSIDGGIGPGTERAFKNKYPNGIIEQLPDDETESNIYGIIQGGLWCKGYPAEYGTITKNFYSPTGKSIKKLRKDMGLSGDAVVTFNIMKGLLSMMQFVLLSNYGGRFEVRDIQQQMNRDYEDYIGVTPCDGLFGREMNIALIKILQAAQGSPPSQADGIIGPGTKSKIRILTRSNYTSYIEHFKVAMYAFICNGYMVEYHSIWTEQLDMAIELFVNQYKLPETTNIDMNIWLQLLLSKGNTDRKAEACDTRFEITDELLSNLKQDGYKIVGRYLTGGDFKEIREGELERIIEGGLSFFPIFQESGLDINYFTSQRGELDAKRAREAAIRLNIPSTIIYFAVDLDVLDYQVDSHILPYFKSLKDKIGPRYKVGIYSSRNVCSRISKAGYAESSFVSDMSTAFSGNLGFPIPENWNYDQFHEIKNYKAKWDLDKVAYSGKEKSVNYLIEKNKTNISISIFELIKKIADLEVAYNNYVLERIRTGGPGISDYFSMLTPHEKIMNILDYLRHKQYSGAKWFLTTNRSVDLIFVNYMKEIETTLHEYFMKYITGESVTSKESYIILDDFGGEIDLAHLAATIQGYARILGFPEFWAGWGGDLATLIFDIDTAHYLDSRLGFNYLAETLLGAEEIKDQMILNTGIGLTFGHADLCSDADAINLEKMISQSNSGSKLLSTILYAYYSNMDGNRLRNFLEDLQNKNTIDGIYDIIKNRMKKEKVLGYNVMDILGNSGLYEILGKNYIPSDEAVSAACMAFAKKILF